MLISAAVVSLVAACLIATGKPLGYGSAAALAILPIALAAVLARPYIFPYGLYAAAVPFDNLLQLGGGVGTATRYIGLFAGAALLFFALRTKKLVAPATAVWCWAAYALWALASIAWAVSADEALKGALSLVQLVALYAVISFVPIGRRDLKLVIAAIVLGGAVAGAFGFYMYRNAADLSQVQTQMQLQRVMLQVGNQAVDVNHYANSLLLPMLLATIGLLRARKPLTVAIWSVAIAPMVLGLLASASREAIVAYIAGGITIAVLAKRYRRRLGLVSLFLVGASLAAPNLWARFGQLLSTGGSGRASIWATGLAAARDHWLIGVGANNFHFAYDAVYLSVFQRYNAGWGRNGHDAPIQTLVEFGAVGLVLLIGAVVMTFRTGAAEARDVTQDPELDDLRVVSIAALVSLVAVSLFVDLLTYKYFWLGICFAAQVRTLSRVRGRPVAPFTR